ESLPPVYRETPEAEDFTERFLSLFDATIGDLDRAIERGPALLDIDGVPDELLAWLGAFLDIVLDPAWDPVRRRAILHAAPDLYRRRGTVAGLIETIRLVTGATPLIEEFPLERAWGAIGRETRLGAVRLFGRAHTRFRLDASRLCEATIRS